MTRCSQSGGARSEIRSEIGQRSLENNAQTTGPGADRKARPRNILGRRLTHGAISRRTGRRASRRHPRPRSDDRSLRRARARGAWGHGGGLRSLRSRAGSQDRDQAPPARAATRLTGARACCARRRRSPSCSTRTSSSSTTWAPSETASSSRWSSSRGEPSTGGCTPGRARAARSWTSISRRGEGWRRRTRPGSSTATSSPTTSW